MTYNAQEISAQGGQPVELYEFVIGVNTYRYTSVDADYESETKDYEAVSISRTEIQETSDLPKNDLTITVPSDFPVANLFRVAPPSAVVALTLFELHNTDGALEKIVKWRGRVLNVSWEGSATATLHCENIFTSLKRTGLRRLYSRQCPHVLYGTACKVVNTAFKVEVTLTAAVGVALNAAALDAFGDGWFSGGYIEWERDDGFIESRGIRDHIGEDVTITHPIPGLAGGMEVDFYPGCDHTLDTCDDKFDNAPNHGGFTFIPEKNPFGGAGFR